MKFNLIILIICIFIIQYSLSIKKESSVYSLFSNYAENKTESDNKPSSQSGNFTTTNKSYIIDLNDPNAELSDWLFISSDKLKDRYHFPVVTRREGDKEMNDFSIEGQLINKKFNDAKKDGSLDRRQFFFRARAGYVYYAETKSELNVLGSILMKNVSDAQPLKYAQNITTVSHCFNIIDYEEAIWRICALDNETKLKWMCSLEDYTKSDIELECNPDKNTQATAVQTRKVTQPVIVIPIPSKQCNEKWDHKNNGNDWECTCKDGRTQSPIDLPTKDDAVLSGSKPIFQYDYISAKAEESTIDGLITQGENIKIRYDRNAIRIPHPNLGKIIATDGGVFKAEEIVFHTPSEHTINGEQFDMEMQVIHYGTTKGDIAKQVILSFLFKKKPGVYNKFIDKLDFFNLPNSIDNLRDITTDLYIPSVFYNTDDEDNEFLKPFSFYTYDGSLTTPPCTERTTHYVVADPIPLSNTVIQLFKEALKIPDVTYEKGNYYIANDMSNSREVQPRNGREVIIYDHIKFNCPEYKPAPKKVEPVGHYEKHDNYVTEYYFVPSTEPSGIPGSLVVTENEAKGVPEKRIE
jgi:carbonic anhydrase